MENETKIRIMRRHFMWKYGYDFRKYLETKDIRYFTLALDAASDLNSWFDVRFKPLLDALTRNRA